MDKRIENIKDFLQSTHDRFPLMKFKCEYDSINHTYIIEVHPQEEFTANNDYVSLESDFWDKFENEHQGYYLLFVTKDSLNHVSIPAFSIGYEEINEIIQPAQMSKFEFNFSLATELTYEGENNYALAA